MSMFFQCASSHVGRVQIHVLHMLLKIVLMAVGREIGIVVAATFPIECAVEGNLLDLLEKSVAM